MSTAITEFYEGLRVLLDDRHATIRLIEDAALLSAVRTAVAMGKVKGYTLTVDRTAVTPAIPLDGTGDPNKLAILLYHTVKLFVSGRPDRYSYKTRALGESFGGWRDFIFEIETNLYDLEHGSYFTSWQSFAGWVKGLTGCDLFAQYTDVNVSAPFQTVNINSNGASVS